MDDIKLYGRNDDQLETLLHIVAKFSKDIQMNFGLDKCATATFMKGQLKKSSNIILDETTTIQDLDQDEFYKYLGVKEKNGIQHGKMKENIRKEYYRRVRLVLKSELNAQNKVTGINTIAVPIISYSFNIINWTVNELIKIDRKTRKLLTVHKMHHPKADTERLYLARDEGGRGLIQIENSYKVATVGLEKYLKEKKDAYTAAVYQHESSKKKYSIVKEARKFNKGVVADMELKDDTLTNEIRKVKFQIKKHYTEELTRKWEEKPLHGVYPAKLRKADTDVKNTNRWLKSSGLKSETEGFIVAAQDQSLSTRSYHSYIIKDGTDPKCRLCNEYNETVDHIISGCPVLANNEYTERHNKVAGYIHWNICKHYNVDVCEKWYEHTPQKVVEKDHTTIMWDMPIITDRKIEANRPDIVVKDKHDNICYMIDVSVPKDSNVGLKELEKKSKYKDLEIEMSKMWNMKIVNIPIIIGSLGLIRKGMQQNCEKLPGSVRLDMCQKIVLLRTAHILRRALSL
jgi:hypothetical protein